MSKDHLTNLLSDRYGNLRISAAQTNVETSSLDVVDTRNPRLLYLSLSLKSHFFKTFYIFFLLE